MLSIELPIVFAHRYITRPANSGGENHVALSPGEFALRRAHGLFALHWQAHGNDYGIGQEIHAWRRAGLAVVVSGSREHFRQLEGIDKDTVPVLITAPAERLRERLQRRGREDAAATAERLQRAVAQDLDLAATITIVNDGTLDEAAEAFVRLLATLRRSPAVRRRA
jgi:ribose 1,5-bisphosphokinase